MTDATDPSDPADPTDPTDGGTAGTARPSARQYRVLTVAQAIFFGLLGVIQFFGPFDDWVEVTAVLVTTALAALIAAVASYWHTHRDQRAERDPGSVDRWLAALAIATIGVVVLDVVAFATDDVEAARPRRMCVYDVTGASAAGAVSYPIMPGGSVSQAFVPQAETVTAVVVIAGLDDELADLDDPHPLTMHLWSEDRRVDETVTLPDLTNNGGSRFDLSRPVEVEADETLTFSVRNDHGHEAVGFYLKPISGDELGVDGDSFVHVVGHRNMNPDYEAPGWAISGCVEALR